MSFSAPHRLSFGGLCAVMAEAVSARLAAAHAGDASIPDRAISAERIAQMKADPLPSEAGLVRVAQALALADHELMAAALCLAAADDPHVARLVADAQLPIGGSRPLLGLAATLLRPLGGSVLALATGQAVQAGLLMLGDEAAALPERSLVLAPHMAAALAGLWSLPPGLAMIAPDAVPLPREHLDQLGRMAAWASARDAATLIVRSADAGEAEAAALHLAAAMDRTPVRIAAEALADHAAWLLASHVLPVVSVSAPPGVAQPVARPPWLAGPLLIVCGAETMVATDGAQQEMQLAIPDVAGRTALWQVHGLGADEAALLAQCYRHGAGRIAALARRACEDAPAQDDAAPGPRAPRIIAAVQAMQTPLDGLAKRLCAQVSRADLVLPPAALEGLDQLVDRIRWRNGLADTLGPALAARYTPGVRALFTGESGTGKTLAAHWLAAQTGLPLYRVDQAALTSKWIGETEKNLATILDAAQHADVMLFFDEADALFGARTDVSDANDRHANAQTNYLLQRIEDHEGIVILASNNRDRFDPAFVRRLDSIMPFPMPDAAARLDLWRVHLGDGHGLGSDELAQIAMAIDLAGGHVRNIVIGAAVRARGGGRAITAADIMAEAVHEYAKLGRQCPAFAAPSSATAA